jgi:hypothetical protein
MSDLSDDSEPQWLAEIVSLGAMRITWDWFGGIIGWYDPSDGWTVDRAGRLYGEGDMLIPLTLDTLAQEALAIVNHTGTETFHDR